MRGYSRSLAIVSAVAVSVGVLGMTTPAAAGTEDFSCSKGGLTGTVLFHFTGSKMANSTVTKIEYKITDTGRNKNNILVEDFIDEGPPVVSQSGDNGIADGKWHVLREKNYKRGDGRGDLVHWKFVFDRAGDDPTCKGSEFVE